MNGIWEYKYCILTVLLIAVAAFLSSCDAKPIARYSSGEVQLNLIFEHDGCKGYRFEDGGYTHYYVACQAAGTTTVTDMVGGKHKHPDDITTVIR